MNLPASIHFVGIAGIGMSALAQLAQARGCVISGSDPGARPEQNPAVARLLAGGARLFCQHRAENVPADAGMVVVTAAVPDANPEVQEAYRRGIRVVSRAEFLGELMAAHPGPRIAVAGTHGKTTTTAMIGVMLQTAGRDPTVLVGGEVAQLGGNLCIGSSTGPFVTEACEAYDSFLSLQPDIGVITNIEPDHLDYFRTFDAVKASFARFAAGVRQRLVICADDPVLIAKADEFARRVPVTRYALDATAAEVRGAVEPGGLVSDLRVITPAGQWETRLQVPGRHNALNALAAVAAGLALGLEPECIASGLNAFRAVGRRQEVLGEVGGVLVVDDYAHHPAEIRATLQAMRSAYPCRRVLAVFQPHLYTRTRDFLDDFAEALAQADGAVVTEIYAAREAPLAGVCAGDIVRRVVQKNPGFPAIFAPDNAVLQQVLREVVRSGDMVLFLGAGDIRAQGEAFIRLLRAGEGQA
ncbi:MAG: UDP-N-acetylmuramate--L-alanine ligase [Chloroherpetonaceae bacterium]|nr:UDP-N-acetylmuramate--L-alanine ligase [Chthonomonadaceae bacterium]MDW8208443.1 UDP-N-acetylmuramate--L-alanine ligase [Chloroherpetonaceae bacterium]